MLEMKGAGLAEQALVAPTGYGTARRMAMGVDGNRVALLAAVLEKKDKPLDPHTLVLGEVGLAGEVRAVGQVEPRHIEAAKMGFKRALLPAGSARQLDEQRGLEVVPVETLSQALEAMF